jgi:hypothetical protein
VTTVGVALGQAFARVILGGGIGGAASLLSADVRGAAVALAADGAAPVDDGAQAALVAGGAIPASTVLTEHAATLLGPALAQLGAAFASGAVGITRRHAAPLGSGAAPLVLAHRAAVTILVRRDPTVAVDR